MNFSKKLTAGVVAALTLVAGSAAFAAIPDADGTVHTCFNKNTGALRVTDPQAVKPKACTKNEQALAVGQKGDKGDPGVQENIVVVKKLTGVLKAFNGDHVVDAYGKVGSPKYHISGKVVIGTLNPSTQVMCQLVAHPSLEVLDTSYGTIVAPPAGGIATQTITVEAASEFTMLTFECNAQDAFATNAVLTLTPVGNIET